MSMQYNFLKELQGVLERHLNSLEILKEIPVIAHKESVVEGSLEELACAGAGVCCVVLTPMPKKLSVTPKALAFEKIGLRINLIDNYYVKNFEDDLLELAERLSHALHGYRPQIANWEGWLSLDEDQPWKEIKNPKNVGRYVLQLNFTATGSKVNELQTN